MYGLKAISAANGWTITFTGLAIVFTGLVVLAAIMANMERFLALWDRRGQLLAGFKHQPRKQPSLVREPRTDRPAASTTDKTQVHLRLDQIEVADHFHLITNRLGEPFSLAQLLEKAGKHGLSGPHRHLDTFLKLGIIVEDSGDRQGFYTWANDVEIVRSSAEE